mmetsp:Transcript_4342/g.10499  ORF Transcript_4342/g.10499 Transcript_4342/m.10499 type:complete len:1328 (+) Transcript_4342:191-4174(+)
MYRGGGGRGWRGAPQGGGSFTFTPRGGGGRGPSRGGFSNSYKRPHPGGAGGAAPNVWKRVKAEDGPALPVLARRGALLGAVREHAVIVVSGETGCGKSSRVPCILDAAARRAGSHPVKMMVSQPRRIAVRMLAERLRSSAQLGQAVGYRMGHGARDEGRATRVWFVTSGYLCRLLAHHASSFDGHTHLVIDEVHERSIDTDILCLLVRRLVRSHPTIRIVLMSATIAAEQFQSYFAQDGAPPPPILFVGVRRFPITLMYPTDPALSALLPPRSRRNLEVLERQTQRGGVNAKPSRDLATKQHEIAVPLCQALGGAGSSVLIFVAGMADIEAFAEKFELINAWPPSVRRNRRYLVIPVHSDVPHDEQLALLGGGGGADCAPLEQGEVEVRVIVATNAAESSVTLPNVDVVICLGQHKHISYDQKTHRQKLELDWISRASAVQRAGRTGRVRPGCVIRLYSERLFSEGFEPFDTAEITRMPLDNVIVSLRAMFGDGPITPLLEETIEPPDILTIARSFRSLYEGRLLSAPDDSGQLTSVGGFVAGLGCDLTIGRLVAMGAQLGVLPESVAIGAALGLPHSPFVQASALVHPAQQYNALVKASLIAQDLLDGGDYCEPLAVVRLLHLWRAASSPAAQRALVNKYSVSWVRVRALAGQHASLCARAATALGLEVESVRALPDPQKMCPGKVLALRLLMVWVFHDQLMMARPLSAASRRELCREADTEALTAELSKGAPSVEAELLIMSKAMRKAIDAGEAGKREELPIGLAITGKAHLVRAALESVLPPSPRCRFALSGGQVEYAVCAAGRPPASAARAELKAEEAPNALSWRLWQLSRSKGADALLLLILLDESSGSPPRLELHLTPNGEAALSAAIEIAFGVGARTIFHMGSEHCKYVVAPDAQTPPSEQRILVARAYKRLREAVQAAKSLTCLLNDEGVLIVCTGGVRADERELCAAVGGVEGEEAFRRKAKSDVFFNARTHALKRRVTFAVDLLSKPRPFALLTDLPLGARVLGQLAVGSRNKAIIKFGDWQQQQAQRAGQIAPGAVGSDSAEEGLKINVPKSDWRIHSSSYTRPGLAYLPYHSLAAAAVHMGDEPVIFAVASTMLDLQGGGCCASGVTVLPPGAAWLTKALLALGLPPAALLDGDNEADDEANDDLPDEVLAAAEAINARYCEVGDRLTADSELAMAVQDLFQVPKHERYTPAAHATEHILLEGTADAAARARVRRVRRALTEPQRLADSVAGLSLATPAVAATGRSAGSAAAAPTLKKAEIKKAGTRTGKSPGSAGFGGDARVEGTLRAGSGGYGGDARLRSLHVASACRALPAA